MSEQAMPREAASSSSWPRWGKPALVASVMVNLLLVGGLLGGLVAGHRHGGVGAHAPIERGIVAFVRSMPKERSQALLQTIEGQRPAFKAARKELRQARGAAFDAFTAANLDAGALRTALTKAGEADDKMQALGTNVFVELAGRLTPAERQAYREWREAQEPRHRGPHGGEGGGRGDKP